MKTQCKAHLISDYTLGYSRYSYETTDTVEDIERAGYFDPASGFLRPRDLIDVWASVASDPVFRSYAVVAIEPEMGSVDIRRLQKLDGESAPAKSRPSLRKSPGSGSRSRRSA